MAFLILLAVATDAVLLNRMRAFWARRLQQQQEQARVDGPVGEEGSHAA